MVRVSCQNGDGGGSWIGEARSYLSGLLGTLRGADRQSSLASIQRTRSTLAGHSAIPHGTNVTRMNANRAIRTAKERTQGLIPISAFSGGI